MLRRAEPSVYHAKRSLEICRRSRIGGFPLAFAYEALARAAAVAGDAKARDRYLAQARKAGSRIASKEDREEFFSQLKTVPHRRRR